MGSTLKNFMTEHFPFDDFLSIGFFTKEMRGDYQSQADRVCEYFGFETVYEYGVEEIRCHLTYGKERPLHVNESGELRQEPFVTVIPGTFY